jgi:hypothetical protein
MPPRAPSSLPRTPWHGTATAAFNGRGPKVEGGCAGR